MDGNKTGEVFMTEPSQLGSVVGELLAHPRDGVVGLVEDLLRLCSEHSLHVDWRGDSCRLRPLGNGKEIVLDKPLGRPVFRAILARLAALCNEHVPQSVSPFGGIGRLVLPGVAGTLQVSFANTSDEQWLDLKPAPSQ